MKLDYNVEAYGLVEPRKRGGKWQGIITEFLDSQKPTAALVELEDAIAAHSRLCVARRLLNAPVFISRRGNVIFLFNTNLEEN